MTILRLKNISSFEQHKHPLPVFVCLEQTVTEMKLQSPSLISPRASFPLRLRKKTNNNQKVHSCSELCVFPFSLNVD